MRRLAREGGRSLTGARRVLAYLSKHVPRMGVPLYYRYGARLNWRRSGDFDARPDPFRIIRVTPSRITYNTGRRFSYTSDRHADCGLVNGGDWDRDPDRFGEQTVYGDGGETTIYRSFVRRFEEGRDWEATPYVQKALRELVRDSDWSWHGCETRAEVFERYREMDRLFGDLRENGYRSKREPFESDEQAPETNPGRFRYLHDEVVVNVGRDGRLLFVGGHHRLSMAKIIGVPAIPVRPFVRHRGRQELRDRALAGAAPPADRRTHPDLRDVLE